jgi:hypothetical protein
MTETDLLAALPGWYAPTAEVALPTLDDFWLARALLETGLAEGGTILNIPSQFGEDKPARRVLQARRTLAGDRRLQHLRDSAKGEA